MTNLFDIHILAVMIAAPGLFILGWASMSLLAWVNRSEATLPFERNCSDELRLVRTGIDLTYGLIPVATGWFIEVYSLTGEATISQTIFWLALVVVLAYPILYYQFMRPSLMSLRMASRNRESAPRQQ